MDRQQEILKILEAYGIKTPQELNRAMLDMKAIDISAFCTPVQKGEIK